MATAVGQNPFNLTAAGELGSHRETMLDNELLLRTELGRPKRRGYGSPGEGYIFGRPNDARHGGADDALHGWPRNLSTTTLPFAKKDKNASRDFMALNKAAVQNGLVTAGENYEFRATHDVRRKTAGSENTRLRTRRIPPTMVFGISTRPSTPIFDLLEHKYQDKWLQQRRQQELAKRKEETQKRKHLWDMKQKRNPSKVYETRASLLRTYQNPVEDAPLWQMPKFKSSAKPSLETFRSPQAREIAFRNFESDQISRKGKLGHGTYEPAVN
ncbi:cilia- and flagella-associated protein 77-like isoform X3 [Ostrea edulis]|uniref:cilia- and flagella-associated protein 77-like isoform X3 n=1 Tax=Ostrea edulis TaxID=37623 RepID=UPI0024AF6CC6|nr:cilia- and flagella-associated protein 77-like isoform X3 [Ostrea edulis]